MITHEARPLGEILRDVAVNFTQIVRGELRLVQAQVRDDAARAGRAVVLIVAGVALGSLAAGFVLLAGVYALARVVDGWIAALVVASAAGLIAGLLISGGIVQLKRLRMPHTSTTLREELQWAKSPNS